VALKKLAGQTAIYGLSSMLGRFLNYLLVPLHTAVFVPAEYGVVTDVYALSAFMAVVLTFGLETAFFRFVKEKDESPELILGNALLSIGFLTVLFWMTILVFKMPVADALGYADQSNFIVWMGFALGFDALSAIPMAKLRLDEKPVWFASVNLTGIGVNILLNVFFIGFAMRNPDSQNWFVQTFYRPEIGVGYVFVANLLASGVKWLMLLPVYVKARLKFSVEVTKKLALYGAPLMLAGFAGIINETLDRRLIRILLEPKIGETAALAQVGIYGACYKLSILITLFIQAFRYAAEPFFFAKAKERESQSVYRDVMNWFTLAVSLMLVFVLLYLDALKYFIANEAYHVGLHIVPILLVANICLGWNYNLSIWYKLSDKTYYGALLAGIGAVITIVANLILIPKMGYEGAAWATLMAYGGITLTSLLLGRKHYYVPYDFKRMIGYPGLGLTLFFISSFNTLEGIPYWLTNTALFLLFIAISTFVERNRIKALLA
jgi:O-antigen/teichoic acid export membrane protein